jgi:hypothetical protein
MLKSLEEEMSEALGYVEVYTEKHPDVLRPTQLPNDEVDFNFDIFAKSVDALARTYSKVAGK